MKDAKEEFTAGPPGLGQVRGRPRGMMVKQILKHQQGLAKCREKRLSGQRQCGQRPGAYSMRDKHVRRVQVCRLEAEESGQGQGPLPRALPADCLLLSMEATLAFSGLSYNKGHHPKYV